jgi:hypothetical protein
MGAVGRDEGAGADAFKSSGRKLPRKHSGNESPHSLEATAADNGNQSPNHATVSNSNRNNRDRSVNPKQLK